MIAIALLTFAVLYVAWCIQRELEEVITNLLWLRYDAWLDDIQAMHETLDRLILLDNQQHFRLELT